MTAGGTQQSNQPVDPTEVIDAIGLVAGRIHGFTTAISQAHQFGIPPGPHDDMTALDYHNAAVEIYTQVMPWTYLIKLADGFTQTQNLITSHRSPAGYETSWYAIERYLRNAATAIRNHAPHNQILTTTGHLQNIEPTTPPVMPYQHLARLTTTNAPTELAHHAQTIRDILRA